MNPQELSRQRKALRKAILRSQANQLQLKQQEYLSRRVRILNIEIDSFSLEEFLVNLHRGIVFTPNVDHLMKLQEDPEFVKAYEKADFRICDSQILMYAAKFLGTPIKAKISGADLFPLFCEYHSDNKDTKIFLIGGASGVPQQAQKNINKRIGREIIVEAYSPSFGFEKNDAECEDILNLIRQSSANVLVMGVGAPKQEKWIVKYHRQLPNINIFMGVGAAIDFAAGNKLRSPQFISNLGLEWLFRLLSEPRRLWKRYLLQDMPFFWLLLKQKLRSRKLEP